MQKSKKSQHYHQRERAGQSIESQLPIDPLAPVRLAMRFERLRDDSLLKIIQAARFGIGLLFDCGKQERLQFWIFLFDLPCDLFVIGDSTNCSTQEKRKGECAGQENPAEKRNRSMG